jgi:hypothetical protein
MNDLDADGSFQCTFAVSDARIAIGENATANKLCISAI